MGKTRGHGSRRGAYRGGGRSGGKGRGDDEESEEEEYEPQRGLGGQRATVGMLPPSDSDGDDGDDEDGAEEQKTKQKQVEEEPDPEQIRKDLDRLELIKKKRETDRLKRIAEEGWDRFAPISETNQPPGHVPSDHPSQKE
eukprot:gene7309-7522_t